MTEQATLDTLTRVATGVSGLDEMLRGGLPSGRTTLVSGSAGSGKTVLALQFLVTGLQQHDEPGVFVTFEERPAAIRENARLLGFPVESFEREGRFSFVDASYDLDLEEEVVGDFDFRALLARIEHAVRAAGASRVAVDSLGTVFSRYADRDRVRAELLRLSESLRRLGVTAVVTSERPTEYGDLGGQSLEEFVYDGVIVLRNVLEDETRRRTVEVLKVRGLPHTRGELPYTIIPRRGMVVVTPQSTALTAGSTEVRIPSGVAELDTMCKGGLFRDSVILVSGATGTGKTLLVTEFCGSAAEQGERALIFSFEESRAQLFRNAAGWGHDFAALEERGQLRIEAAYPEVSTLEDHMVRLRQVVEEFRPDRIAVDSLTALERVAPPRLFREFLIGLTSFVKHRQAAAMFTSTSRTLLGGQSVTEAHISTLTDMIILLRYVETGAEIRRGLAVLKLRGSGHDKRIHEYTIDGSGMRIHQPFSGMQGILGGHPQPSGSFLTGEH